MRHARRLVGSNDEIGALLIDGASERLRLRPVKGKTLYRASSDEPGIAQVTARLAQVLEKGAWHGR